MKKRSLIALLMALVIAMVPITDGVYGMEMTQEMLQELKQFIADNYVDEITVEELTGDTPEEIFQHLDIHSRYYTPEDFQVFLERLMGKYAGIGAYVDEVDGRIFLTPMEGSPSWEAGLQAGDELVTVDGKNVQGMSSGEIVGWIVGEVGTEVTIGVHREGHDGVIEVTITRDYITYETVHHEVVDNVGYLAISEFNENSFEDTSMALEEFQQQGIDNLVIDLRNNPGGLLNEVIEIARLLMKKGPILHVNYRDTSVSYMSYLTKPKFRNIVVLVNGNSASASEVLAAAIQDSNSGVIVGQQTYGKGSVQSLYRAANGGGFKLTEARYVSPNKRRIDGVGVKPDYEVKEGSELEFALKHVRKLLLMKKLRALK